MKKQAYIKPSTNIIVLQSESHIMETSAYEISSSSGLNDPFGIGGKSDGTHEVNSKYGDLWDFDEEE